MPTQPDPDVDQVRLVVDGREWIVRVSGRSGTDRLPLLLLDFRDAAEADAPDRRADRETFLVGRALSDLSSVVLEAAFSQSSLRSEKTRDQGFFAEASEPRRR